MKNRSFEDDPDAILKQAAEFALPGPSPPPDDPPAALRAAGDWNEERVAAIDNRSIRT